MWERPKKFQLDFKNFKISGKGFIERMKWNIFWKKVFQNSSSSEKKTTLENALEIIYEFGRHFWPERDFRAIFWQSRIKKSDQSKNFPVKIRNV